MRLLRRRQESPSLRMPPALKYRSISGKGSKLGGKGGKTGKGEKGGSKGKGKMEARSEMKPVRMRPWLETLLNEESCHGLKWLDKERLVFQITWCHASRHDFEPGKHADVFIQYAAVTGRKGVSARSKTGYDSKLKSNFRSALHSLIDCIPVKDETKARDKTVKVYQFIDSTHLEYQKRKARKNNSQRKNKIRKSPDSCSKDPEEESVPEGDVASLLPKAESQRDIPLDESIILPEEAASFIQNQKHYKISFDQRLSSPGASPISCINSPISCTASTPSILTRFSDCQSLASIVTAPCSEPFLSSTISDSSKISLSESPECKSWMENTETKSIIDFDNTMSCEIQTQQVLLPDFKSLGVEDSFQEPVRHSCPKLNSGGCVRVKKEKPFQPQVEQVENFLNQNSPVIILDSSNTVEIVTFNDPFLPLTAATGESNEYILSTQYDEANEGSTFQTDIDETIMFSCIDVLENASDNDNTEYVQLENVDARLLGKQHNSYNTF